MITSFRRFFQSKIGIAVTLAFLALIAVAFASMDVSSNATFGGVSGGDRVAVVGDRKVGTAELRQAAENGLDQVRQGNPTLSMPAFLEQGGLDQVTDTLLERVAIAEFGRKYGIRAGDNLINSQIRMIPAFRGADGNFDETIYRSTLSQQGLNEASVRENIGDSLIAQQIVQPAGFGTVVPDKLTTRYASLFKERRRGSIGLLESTAYAPDNDPTDEQVSAYYTANRGDYIRPERRIVRYATFGADAVGDIAAPTNAEIASRYEQNASEYAASEDRTLTQVVVSTQQAADSIRQRVAAGASLESVASEAGFSATTLGPISRSDYAGDTSAAVAAAAFAANRGNVAEVKRSGFGWHVVRVDGIDQKAGKSIEQARPEIVAALTQERRRLAFNELAESIEDRFSDGESLNDVAKSVGAEVEATKPLTAAGIVYGTQNEQAPQILARALQTAFQMEEGNPQLAEAVPGETFLLFEATDITASAAAPLGDIRDQIEADWKRSEGAKLAKAAADRVMKRVREGQTLTAAISAEQKALPPVDQLNITREQLLQRQNNVPAPLALFFSMAQGTQKRLEGPRNAGWFIVALDSIEAGAISRDDPLFAQAKVQFSGQLAEEYAEQMGNAIRQDVTVERNDTAIEAVRRQLSGETQP